MLINEARTNVEFLDLDNDAVSSEIQGKEERMDKDAIENGFEVFLVLTYISAQNKQRHHSKNSEIATEVSSKW